MKILSITLIAILSFSNFSGLSSKEDSQTFEYGELSCFEGARQVVLLEDGEINTSNVGRVNTLTAACEAGLISFGDNEDVESPK